MLWMNNTGLFSTRCDLVDECTEIMLRMGEGEMACYTSCARLVPSPREPGPLFANERALGRRVSDEFIRELHRSGDELGHGREASSYILRYMDLLP